MGPLGAAVITVHMGLVGGECFTSGKNRQSYILTGAWYIGPSVSLNLCK